MSFNVLNHSKKRRNNRFRFFKIRRKEEIIGFVFLKFCVNIYSDYLELSKIQFKREGTD